VFGNCLTLVDFGLKCELLEFETFIRLEHTPENAPDFRIEDYARSHPFSYSEDESPDLAAYILVELTPELSGDAQTLLLRHALRSGDAVQLASCLYLQRETGQRVLFAAFDERLNNAARAEGLTLAPLG